MPTAPPNVCSLGNTRSDRRAARTTRLTQLKHQPNRIGPAINLKTAKALSIDIPATLIGHAGACSLDGLRVQPHDADSAFTGRVN